MIETHKTFESGVINMVGLLEGKITWIFF